MTCNVEVTKSKISSTITAKRTWKKTSLEVRTSDSKVGAQKMPHLASLCAGDADENRVLAKEGARHFAFITFFNVKKFNSKATQSPLEEDKWNSYWESHPRRQHTLVDQPQSRLLVNSSLCEHVALQLRLSAVTGFLAKDTHGRTQTSSWWLWRGGIEVWWPGASMTKSAAA